jgi:diketogulonate reductase-like aldo/keto reductase
MQGLDKPTGSQEPALQRQQRRTILRGIGALALAGQSVGPGAAARPAGSAAPADDPATALQSPPLLDLDARQSAATSFAQAATPPGRAHSGTATAMKIQTRPIPSSGEALPIVGCGTYVGFDVEPGTAAYRELPAVLKALFDAGGSVIDSSPMYGRAETTVGELLESPTVRERAFIATKVWTSSRERGIEQMTQSMQRLKAQPIDLMQIHNLVDWRAHLLTLNEWKQRGKVRYLGISHYTPSAYGQLEAVMREHALDFVQLNYSVDEREAEARLLPLAAERGIAVIVNRPFGGGGLLRKLGNRPLPAWAADLGCASWAQILLKFVLGHPAVTCAIPGTGKAAHMLDNLAAGVGPMPDQAMRDRMAAEWL